MNDPPEGAGDIGVLLIQLGTPDAPEAKAVGRYLKEFLSDTRVVDAPRGWWMPLLHGVIVPRRAPRSAELYRKIWRPDGVSPLLHTTREVTEHLAGRLRRRGVQVRYAMRYGEPALRRVVDGMLASGVRRLMVFPLYPQYAASTTASGVDGVMAALSGRRFLPALRFAPSFPTHPLYLDALARTIRELGQPGMHTLFSFHGLPQRHVEEGDPYASECDATVRGVVERLGLTREEWSLAYQSRFGREAWLEPATSAWLAQLPGKGIKQVQVVCPGFVADCLETLEEIAHTNREIFLAAGGEAFLYIPCLNQRPDWLLALETLVVEELAGWLEG